MWQKKYGAANDAKYLSDLHDHILVYAKKKDEWRPNLFERPEALNAKYSNPDADPRGDWYSTNLSVKTYSAANDYEIVSPSGHSFRAPPSRAWVVSRDRFQELLADNRIWFGKDGTSRPYLKTFLSEVQAGIVPTTWWPHEDAGHNIEGKSEIRKLFGDDTNLFDTPKPTRLIRRLIRMAEGAEASGIFMDFFAGSGATADAVLQANQADGGTRRFVLVQLPEPTDNPKFATLAKVCAERLRRAAVRIRDESSEYVGDLGFRVFKLTSSNIRAWEPDRDNIAATLEDAVQHLKSDRTEQDVLYELLLKLGLDLCVPIETKKLLGKAVHSIGGGVLIACLADKIEREEVEKLGLGIVEWRKALAPAGDTTCVFRDSAFDDDVAKTNLAAILEQNGIATVRSL